MERWLEIYAALIMTIVPGLMAIGAFVVAGYTFAGGTEWNKLWGFVPVIIGFFALAPFFMWASELYSLIIAARK